MNTKTVSQTDVDLIQAIVLRYEQHKHASGESSLNHDGGSTAEALLICHRDAMPLDLHAMRNSTSTIVVRDIDAIYVNLDFAKRKLQNGFVPSFASIESEQYLASCNQENCQCAKCVSTRSAAILQSITAQLDDVDEFLQKENAKQAVIEFIDGDDDKAFEYFSHLTDENKLNLLRKLFFAEKRFSAAYGRSINSFDSLQTNEVAA